MMRKILKHICGINKDVAIVMSLLFVSVSSALAEKFDACRDTSIWSAYLVDNTTDEILETYYPDEFFTSEGGAIPGYDSNRDMYKVPNFVFNMQSCDLDSFEIYFKYRYSDFYVSKMSRAISTIWFTVKEEFELDFDDILKSKTNKRQVSLSNVDNRNEDSELRYVNYESVMWFKYKDGVIHKSGGGSSNYNICTLDQLGLSWDILGGMITYMSVKINDTLYEEDFTDCSNAMKYEDCPPKEPDSIKVVCEQVPNCKYDEYIFSVESNLRGIHWVGKDGYLGDADVMRIEKYSYMGGCIAVWAQKDECTPPVYDTVCPPLPDLTVPEVELEETVCWNEEFLINGKRVTESGVYEEVYTGANGCDSIVRFKVTVNSADTTISDTVYRCGIKTVTDSTFIRDTIEVSGGCPGLQMTPLGKVSSRNHVAINTIKEDKGEVNVDVHNNVGNITYTTIWMARDEEVKNDGSLTFDKAGMYKIIAYDETTGCKDSISFYYRTPIKPDEYFCPDNPEDYTWDIAGIEKYTNYRIDIFDRFGRKLIHYENEFDGWDGYYKGNPMPSTDYWYTIEVDEGDYSEHGHFTLIRQPK